METAGASGAVSTRLVLAPCPCHGETKSLSEDNKLPRLTFVPYTVPSFTPYEFASHYRLSVDAFEWLLAELGPQLQSKQLFERHSLCARELLLPILWWFSTTESLRSVAFRFNLTEKELDAVFEKVLGALCGLSPAVVGWPNATERTIISANLKAQGGLEDAVGVVDGTYVRIKVDEDNTRYMTLQAICDDKRRFIDCFAGYDSSTANNDVFVESDIFKDVEKYRDEHFSPHQFLVADKTYEARTFCVPPFKLGRDSAKWQRKFNCLHAKTRQVMERAFRLFFGRFQRCRLFDSSRPEWIPSTLIAASVLHNVCLAHDPDHLCAKYEAEGAVYMQDRKEWDSHGELVWHSVATAPPTNNAGNEFRLQVARKMGLNDDE